LEGKVEEEGRRERDVLVGTNEFLCTQNLRIV
jgi:hypothetical protein